MLKMKFVSFAMNKLIDWKVSGPDSEQRENSRCYIWGKVKNESKVSKELSLITPDGYSFTVDSALAAVKKIDSEDIDKGFQTPSLAFGKNFITSIDGVSV